MMAASTVATATSGKQSRFAPLLLLVFLVAFAIREHFVLTTIVDVPIRGDIRDYVAYAWNLLHHGTFSSMSPQVAPPPADSYRSPGYPFLLALCMMLRPENAGWYGLALQAQVVLGSATVLLAMLLARRWLRPVWSALVGFLLALWPHHVAATGVLMPEVLFGFTLVAGLYCFARSWASRRGAWFVATGAVFGYACLVNPLLALFPPCLAAMMWLKKERTGAALVLGVFLLPVVALALRNAQLDDTVKSGAGRAAVNFVQGSWPQYHDAANRFRAGDPMAVAIMQEIDRETTLLYQDPQVGLARIASRLANDPAGYAAWYLWEKPWLLWDWEIRLGANDFYFLKVRNSPLDNSAVLRAAIGALRLLNPLLSALTLGCALGLLLFGWRQDAWMPAVATGALIAYFTLMHVLLQAEPRYAIAYRGIALVLVATAVSTMVRTVARRISRLPVRNSGTV